MLLSRREFIKKNGLGLFAVALPPFVNMHTENEGMIMTVNGPIKPASLGFTLSHEHIMVDFIGAANVSRERYNVGEVIKTALPFLQRLKPVGCKTLVDCTPAYLGRDVSVLKKLSGISKLNILTNTGYYGAAKEKFLPASAYEETALQIARRWISEWEHGIDGTTIKPGFIKTGVDLAPISAVQAKLIRAAAITHLQTGLTIAVHTGSGEAANVQLDILRIEGVSPEARIWVHAQNELDSSYHIAAAKYGSWVSFDGVNKKDLANYIHSLQMMKREKLLHRVLVSQDAGWYHVGEEGGGVYNDYQTIFTHFIPALIKEGFTQEEIDRIFITNPAKALAIKVRKL